MRFTATVQTLIFGKKAISIECPRWPKPGEANAWMAGKVALYRTHFPDEAYRLFDISSGDYLPKSVHVAGNFGAEELAEYRRLKTLNADLVEQARQSDGHRFSRSLIYDPEDWPSEKMLP